MPRLQPKVALGSELRPLRAVRRLAGLTTSGSGVISLTSRRAIVGVADGVLELELGELPS